MPIPYKTSSKWHAKSCKIAKRHAGYERKQVKNKLNATRKKVVIVMSI
jgi:hypothetical protein